MTSPTVITGGTGFVGSNLAAALAVAGHQIVIIDNLSRTGSATNLRRLHDDPALEGRITFHPIDVRDQATCADVIRATSPRAVVHLAGQPAVTTSLTDPVGDFEINAGGTLSVLEAVRQHASDAHVIFASTNKVYGDLGTLAVAQRDSRYILPDHPDGIDETFPTRPVAPYGCSKYAADCYVRDYAQTYGMRTTVLRMSCIYGSWQHGTTDQGWVSWFTRAALTRQPITVYGDGLQVRDLLHIDDLVDLLVEIVRTGRGANETFNVGGGPDFSLSIWAEFGELLADLVGNPISVRHEPPRPGDQPVYVSDIRKVSSHLSWKPRRPPADGIAEMVTWQRTKGD